MNRKQGLVLLFVALINCQCASITDRHQYIRIVPPDQHTEVYFDDQKVTKGEPHTLRFTRESEPKLRLVRGQKEVKKKLSTSYRWGQSFAGNALMFTYAPIGWLVDWITGAAWESEEFLNKEKHFPLNSQSQIFIFPPTGVTSLDSQQMGQELYEWFLKKYPHSKIISYEKSYYKALSFGFDHQSLVDKKDRDVGSYAELIHDTNATHLALSRYDETTNSLEIEIISPYSERKIASHNIATIKPESKDSTWNWVVSEFFELLPNTVSLGSIQTNIYGCARQVSTNIDRYCAKARTGSPFEFISAINFTNVLHFRKRETWGLYLRFFPDFNLAYNDVEFSEIDQSLEDLYLDWAYISLGYGPRLSFIIPIGELFAEMTPFYAANYLRLHSNSMDQTQYKGKFGVSIQMGLNSWLSNRWNLRFFVKGSNQNILENQALDQIDAGTQFDRGIAILQTGLSIGYYFSSEKAYITDAFLQSEN